MSIEHIRRKRGVINKIELGIGFYIEIILIVKWNWMESETHMLKNVWKMKREIFKNCFN
jgi:hypothetical protein